MNSQPLWQEFLNAVFLVGGLFGLLVAVNRRAFARYWRAFGRALDDTRTRSTNEVA